MSDKALPFLIQAPVTILAVVAVVSFAAWQMRRDNKEFSVHRVFGVALAALMLGSLPFAAAFWWLAPTDAGRHSPYLLAAEFVPIGVLEVWGIVYGVRRLRERHRAATSLAGMVRRLDPDQRHQTR